MFLPAVKPYSDKFPCPVRSIRSSGRGANAPFRPRSQQDRRSCNMRPGRHLPSRVDLHTLRSPHDGTRARFGRTSRHPHRLRWGTCLCLTGFLGTQTSLAFANLTNSTRRPIRSSSLAFTLHDDHILIGIIFHFNKFSFLFFFFYLYQLAFLLFLILRFSARSTSKDFWLEK